jgi:hypothetical protein
MGDLVIRRKDSTDFVFQVTGFDGDYVFLKGIRLPITTISSTEKLIKLNRKRKKVFGNLKRVK